MPSTYAHYRMGCEVREKISGGAKDAVENTRRFILQGFTDRISFFITDRSWQTGPAA